MAALGAFFAGIWTWFLTLLGSAEAQKQTDQIARDADEIQSLKDMSKIDAATGAMSTSDLVKQLRSQTSARRPLA